MIKNMLKKVFTLLITASTVCSLTACCSIMPAGKEVLPVMKGDEFGEGAVGRNGGVSSFSEDTSKAGIGILKAGGNAVDAAVATAFAVGVTEPQHSGIGGCGMMTIYLKETNEYITFEYLETAPEAQVSGLYDPETDRWTAKNAAVPGQVYGLLDALAKYGTMTPEQVMAPAIKLAREGFVLDPIVAKAIAASFETFSKEGKKYELSLVTNDLGQPYSAGDLYINTDLADTLERIAQNGTAEFYSGETAQKLIESVQAGGSVMTMEDLAKYTSMQRDPIVTEYYGYDIVTVAPPSNGGDWLLEMLNIMEDKDIASLEQGSAEYWRVFNEAGRIGMRDTFTYSGDPAFFDLPTAQMISKEFAAERAALTGDTGVLKNIPLSDLPVKRISAESGRIDPAVMEALVSMGYIPKEGIADYDITLGGIAAILLDEDGYFYAGADHRRTCKALAY